MGTGEGEPGMGNGKSPSMASPFLSWITDLVSFPTTHLLLGKPDFLKCKPSLGSSQPKTPSMAPRGY